MNDFFLHASPCFEAIFMAPIKRRSRLAKILLQHSVGLGTKSVVFQEPIKKSKTVRLSGALDISVREDGF